MTAIIAPELERMGFPAAEATVDTSGLRWYGPAEVGELSREEAGVIAARVVPAYGAANGLDRQQVGAASALVIEALYGCFTGRHDALASLGGMAVSCGHAAEQATRRQLGDDRAAALGRAIESDLAGLSSA